MCPKCSSKEVGDFLKRPSYLDSYLKLNKCHECDCVFLTFDLVQEESEMVVNV